MAKHNLKTWPEFYDAITAGEKTWEFRRDDRGFRVGDVLVLELWKPGENGGNYEYESAGGDLHFSIKSQRVVVTYILHGGRLGIPEHYCVMSIVPEDAPHNENPDDRAGEGV